MSHKLGMILSKGITEIRELSEEEYQEYKKASDSLSDFSRGQQLYTIVSLNYDDFINVIKQYTNEYAENAQHINSLIMEKMVLNINRFLLNYLSSVRSFLDHSGTQLNKNYGKQSDRLKRFKEICSKAYDNCFSYRFLSKLRNYSQHCNMPIGKLTLHSIEDPPYSNNIIHSLEAKFILVRLLEFDSWGLQIKKELSQLPSEFDVEPHVVSMMKCIEKINVFLIDEDLQELYKSVDFIEHLIKPTQGEEGTPCILKFLEIKRGENEKVKGITMEITHIPWHILEIVRNIRKEKSSKS